MLLLQEKLLSNVYGNLMNYFDTTASATADKDGVSFGGTLAENEAIKIGNYNT